MQTDQIIEVPRNPIWRVPWSLSIVFLLLSYKSPAFAGIQADLQLLAVPLAAYAGRRYGVHGVIAMMLGAMLAVALPLWFAPAGTNFLSVWLRPVLFGAASAILSVLVQSGWGSLGYTSGIFLSSLIVAWIASQPQPIAAVLVKRVAPIRILVLIVLLSLVIDGWNEDRGGDIRVSIWYGPFAALSILVLLLGVSESNRKWALRIMGVITVIGVMFTLHSASLGQGSAMYERDMAPWLERVFGLPWHTRFWLSQPATYFLLAACFFVGSYLRKLATSIPADIGVWRQRSLIVITLILLWGAGFLEQALVARKDLSIHISFTGEYLALPLAGLVAGLLMRYRGIAWCILLALVVSGAAMGFGIVFDRSWWVALEAPLVVWAYGILGVYLRSLAIEAATGSATEKPFDFGIQWRRRAGRWVVFLLVAGFTLVPDMLIELEHELWIGITTGEAFAGIDEIEIAMLSIVTLALYAVGLFLVLRWAPRLLEDVGSVIKRPQKILTMACQSVQRFWKLRKS